MNEEGKKAGLQTEVFCNAVLECNCLLSGVFLLNVNQES